MLFENDISIEKIEEVKEDCISIINCISELEQNIEEFKGKHQTYRLLGEVIQQGLADPFIEILDNKMVTLKELQALFEHFSELADREKDARLIDSTVWGEVKISFKK